MRCNHSIERLTRVKVLVGLGVALAIGVMIFSILVRVGEILSSITSRQRRYIYAREVYKGLVGYAMDHDGFFPGAGPDGRKLKSSNEAYRGLIPKYVPDERIFFSRGIAWTPDLPGSGLAAKAILGRGKNSFAYVPNINIESNAALPLVADGFAKGMPGSYSLVPGTKGYLGCDMLSIVVRVDGSAKDEVVNQRNLRVYSDRGDVPKGDLFEVSKNWLRPEQVPLNPE